MTEHVERDPLAKEVIAHLRMLTRRSAFVEPADPAHGALYGTSIEALFHLLETGTVREDPYDDIYEREKDDRWLYVVPTPGLMPNAADREHFDSQNVREMASLFAARSAQTDAFLHMLGLPVMNNRGTVRAYSIFQELGDEYDEEWMAGRTEIFLKTGASLEVIHFAIETARERKGIVLGISRIIRNGGF